MKKGLFFVSVFGVFSIIILMLTNPTICKDGAVYGLMLSSTVIIPSIFPFSVFVLFILKTNLLNKLNFLSGLTEKLFGLNSDTFSVFLLSLFGGYPTGAKLLSGAVELKKIDKATAGVMQSFCVNAGPAFIILAVGSGMLNSKKIGYVLFVSHILASFLLAAILKKRIKNKPAATKKINFNIMDNFVSSVAESASATLSVCSFVIIFSVILNYISFYSQKFAFLKKIGYLLEVTNAVSQNRNIFIISFLLGFSGICVWFQIFSLARNFKINYPLFLLFRILHGAFSSGFTFIILKLFKISAPTLSNGVSAYFTFTGTTLSVALSLICMGIIFIISLYTKNYAGNLLEDLV